MEELSQEQPIIINEIQVPLGLPISEIDDAGELIRRQRENIQEPNLPIPQPRQDNI